MFGECIDFAPQPSSGRRGKQHHMLPISQAEKPQLTPKEQANRLANQVGLDTTLLNGLAPELLQGVGPSELRRAMRNAVMALQQGKVVTVISTENLEDFLAGKIAMLPLSVRFPLMAEWSGAQQGADSKMPLAFDKPARNRGPTVPSSSGATFLSFDSLPGAGGSQQERSSFGPKVEGEEEARRKKAKEKLLQKKRRQALSEAYAYQEQEDDTGWQNAVEYQHEPPQQPGAVQVSNAFLEEIQRRKGDQELQEKHASALQEQEAKRAVSKVLLNFEKTKAAVEEGLQAARQSVKLLSGPESAAKKAQDADNGNQDAPNKDIFEADATVDNTPQKAGSEQDQASTKREFDEGGGSLEYRNEGRRDRRSGGAAQYTRGRRNSGGQDQEYWRGGEDEDFECWRDTPQRGRRSDSRDYYRSERGYGRRGEARSYEEQPPFHERGDVYLARRERRHGQRYDDDAGRAYPRGERHDRLCAASRSRSRPLNDGDYYDYDRRADYQRWQQDSRSPDRQYNYNQDYRRGGARYQERFDSRGRGYDMPRDRGNHLRREPGLHHRRADSRSPIPDGDDRNQRPRRRIEHDQRYAESSGRGYARDRQEQEPPLTRRPHGRRRRADVEATDGRSRSQPRFREKIQAPEKQKEMPESAVGRQFAEKPASTGTQASAAGDEKRAPPKNAFSSSPGPATPAAAAAAAATAGATAKPAPALRQLACRNGWAEYVDQSTGEHVYKNVLTGEMTKRKPTEFGSLISDTMNQRRLAWLANQRATQQVGELQMAARAMGMVPQAGMAPMAGMPPMAGMAPGPM